MADTAFPALDADVVPETDTIFDPVCMPRRRATLRLLSSAPEFGIITDIPSLDALEADWTALQAAHGRSHQLFQSFAWVRHWCTHFLATSDQADPLTLYIVTARVSGRLVMVWPLVREYRHGQCQVMWLGAPVSQYGDALMANEQDAGKLIEAGLDFISRAPENDIVVLRKVRADSQVAAALDRRSPAITAAEIAPYINLPASSSFDIFQRRYTAKARKNRRRHRRRLDERGEVTFEVVRQGPRATELIRLALSFKRRWLNSRRLVSLAFCDERIDGFFESFPATLPRGLASACDIHVFMLACNGRPVAINVAFQCGTRLLTHIAAYDPEFERYSPGSLLFERSINHCLDSGFRVFDLLSPGDAYKLDWADQCVPVHDYAIGLTPRGRIYETFYIRRLRPVMKYAVARIPRLVRPVARMFNP